MNKTLRTATAILSANILWMNSALAGVSEATKASEITSRHECSVTKKSTNKVIPATCGYKTDENGRKIKVKEFFDTEISMFIQQYLISPEERDSSGKVTKKAIIEEVKSVIKPAASPAPNSLQSNVSSSVSSEPEVFSRPRLMEETDRTVEKSNNYLIVGGAVVAVIAGAIGVKMYRSAKKNARQTDYAAQIEEMNRPNRAAAKKTLTSAEAASFPKEVKLPKNSPLGAGRTVKLNGHVRSSDVPRNASRVRTDDGHTVVIYRDSNDVLFTYMLWNNAMLPHNVYYGAAPSFAGGSHSVAPAIVNDRPSFGTVPSDSNLNFSAPRDADVARPTVTESPSMIETFAQVRAEPVSDRVMTYSESDYAPAPAPAPRDDSSSIFSSRGDDSNSNSRVFESPAPAPSTDWFSSSSSDSVGSSSGGSSDSGGGSSSSSYE